jgi:hypothetical protein
VPEKKQIVWLRNDQAWRGMFFGAGYLENATLSGMWPDLNWSKMQLRADLTFSFMMYLLVVWFQVDENKIQGSTFLKGQRL